MTFVECVALSSWDHSVIGRVFVNLDDIQAVTICDSPDWATIRLRNSNSDLIFITSKDGRRLSEELALLASKKGDAR